MFKQSSLLSVAVALCLSACFENELAASTSEISPFAEIPLEGDSDNLWRESHHPFIGATPVDVDGDDQLEIFVGGGEGHSDRLFFYRQGRLINQIEGTGLSSVRATYGANSIDFDDDGDTDLILARSNGVFWYENNAGRFTQHQILPMPDKTSAFSVALSDIDKDGDLDIYVSMFVDFANFRSVTFNDPSHARQNRMLRNDGDNRFVDVTQESGTAGLQNSFLASFVDLDEDGWQDLVVAQNTGQVEVFRNSGNGRFEKKDFATGWGFWMSLTTGDFDRDGDLDLFFSNSGNSIPHFFLEFLSDATDEQPRNYEWTLMRNDGNFQFTNVTQAVGLNGQGFGWGGVFEDLTLDGRLELLVAQNYIKWPLHRAFPLKARTLVQSGDGFRHSPELGLENPYFGQVPLVLDINQDGRPDVFWVNMEGFNRAFLNTSDNHFLTLAFADNLASLGARATLIMADGSQSYLREVQNSGGMSADQWTGLVFGLGDSTSVQRVLIEWLDGTTQTLDNPAIDRTIYIDKP